MSAITSNRVTEEGASVLSSRRRFLKKLACGSLVLLGASSDIAVAAHPLYAPASSVSYKPQARPRQRLYKELALHNPNTGESLKRVYFEDGRFVGGALAEFNFLLRDHHTNTPHPIDPALFDQLHDLQQMLAINQPFHIISGYRSPGTNAHLRQQSSGVAKYSLHMEGRAIDIRLEGVSTRFVRDAAVALARGGVGYYPHTNFVHLDTGDIRVW